jgi:hypothetical protein
MTILLSIVSGPIRQKLWMPGLAFVLALLLMVPLAFLVLWLRTPGVLEGAAWPLPLRGRWLLRFVEWLLAGVVLFCVFLFITSGLGFFLLFPWLAR